MSFGELFVREMSSMNCPSRKCPSGKCPLGNCSSSKPDKNITVLQKPCLKIVSETTQDISVTKSSLTALNFLNTSGN